MGKTPVAAPLLREDLAVCAKDILVQRPGVEKAQRAAGLSTPTWSSEHCCLSPVSALAKSLPIVFGSKTSTCTPLCAGDHLLSAAYARSEPGSKSAQMPITYFTKICPGAQRCGHCAWSTELQGQPAAIGEKDLLCEICTAIEGLGGDRSRLQLQLADLYVLDADQFREARTEIGDRTFEAVGAAALNILTSRVPALKRAREEMRHDWLVRTLSLLTNGNWVIQCWAKRLADDTRDLCQCKAAIGHFPITIRGPIYEFVCDDVRRLYKHLLVVKRLCYHTLEQPVFWHPAEDFQEDHDGTSNRARLVGVYSYIVEHMHKPKLLSLKRKLVKHERFVKANWAMEQRTYIIRKVISVLDLMLNREINVVGAPFDHGPVA